MVDRVHLHQIKGERTCRDKYLEPLKFTSLSQRGLSMTRLILSLILFATSTTFAMSKAEPLAEDWSDNLQVLETWLEAQRSYRGIPGLAVGIVHDGEVVYAQGFGHADQERVIPATPETVFRIASITKTFTATAILQLRDAGKLRLDDPITMHLPWFNIQNTFPDAPPITILNLLTHTSGLPREAAYPYWTTHEFPTIEEIKSKLPQQQTIYEPGTEIKYSNLGVTLAGEIVAAVSGMPYGEYVETHILAPLGMTSTSVHPEQALLDRMTVPYSQRLPDDRRVAWEHADTEGIAPAANIVSTVEDMCRYVAMHCNEQYQGNDAVLKGSTLREMHRVHFLDDSWSGGWGLGFYVRPRYGENVVGHDGWVAGNRTRIFFIPDRKVGVVVMTNADDGVPTSFAWGILDYVLPLIPASSEAAEPTAVANLDQYAGHYRDPFWWNMDVMVLDGQLVKLEYGYPPEDSPASGIVKLFPTSEEHVFRMSGPNGNGETVRFVFDDRGQVARVYVGDNFYGRPEDYPYPKD